MSEATPIGSGRYGLLGTLSTTLPRIVRHRGVDTILDRDVTILVLTDATLHRDNVLESASRAVLVEDQRLQQVYDVERAEPSVIVTEPLTGRTFSSLVSRGMPPAQARAIIGETAQALDAGARKGLHHLNLSPESIRVLPDGTVKVSGLGIEAAALDLESRVAGHDPSAADRVDARSLVEILYYGLTGRWPGKRPGIPSAPRLGGVPVKPSTLVPGIDPVLDELCERTWSSQPPISSAEVARSLGTWDQVTGYHESGTTHVPSPLVERRHRWQWQRLRRCDGRRQRRRSRCRQRGARSPGQAAAYRRGQEHHGQRPSGTDGTRTGSAGAGTVRARRLRRTGRADLRHGGGLGCHGTGHAGP